MDDSITLDAETCKKIRGSKAPFRLLDQNGAEIGLAFAALDFPEELDGTELTIEQAHLILADPRRYTMEEVMRLVEG